MSHSFNLDDKCELVFDSSDVDEREIPVPVWKKLTELDRKLKYFNFLRHKFIEERDQAAGDNSELVCVKVDDRVFRCHRQILVFNSEYFAALFRDHFEDSKLKMMNLPSQYVASASIFSKLLQAMYGEPLKIEVNDAIPLFVASCYLQLNHFLNICKQYIRDNLAVINAFELMILPELKFDVSLYNIVQKFVCRNFAKLQMSMLGIPLVLFEELFANPELFLVNKEEVLKFGREWIIHDLEHRREHLQKVCSILKPFHTPSDQSLKLVSIMKSHLQEDYNVEVAMNLLLDISPDLQSREAHGLEVTKSLFFFQPSENDELLVSTYKNKAWIHLDNLRLPAAIDVISVYEGAVTNDSFYFSAELKSSNVIFRGWNVRREEWIELMSPQVMPECLVSFNSTVYSYEHSSDSHQICFFEPVLNRWLKVPAVKFPTRKAGVVSNEFVLFKVGGIPPRNTRQMSNLIEMYDNRCGSWSLITPVKNQSMTGNISYSKKICYYDNVLYLFDSNKLARFDIRNQKWLLHNDKSVKEYICTDSKEMLVDFATILDGSLCCITGRAVNLFDRSNLHCTGIIHNTFHLMKPISVPYSS